MGMTDKEREDAQKKHHPFYDAKAQTEPSADMRNLAKMYWEMFVALTLEGFSENQALKIIGEIIAGTFSTYKQGD